MKIGTTNLGTTPTRAGMTTAMFSLVAFSLIAVSSINLNLSQAFLSDAASGGWDIEAESASSIPGGDIEAELAKRGVDTSEVVATGIVTGPIHSPVAGRVKGDETWSLVTCHGMDDVFIGDTAWKLSQRASGYTTDEDVLEAVRSQPDLVIIDALTASGEADFGPNGNALQIHSIDLQNSSFDPVVIELRGSDGSIHDLTVIAVIDPSMSTFEGVFGNEQFAKSMFGSSTVTSFHMRLEDPSQADNLSKQIKSALLPFGVRAEPISNRLRREQQEGNGFFSILEGYMALGLVIGIATVGVIAFRNVVERRQQVGVMRALGFQRYQVALTFLIESFALVIPGVVTGILLGLALSYRLVTNGSIETTGDIAFAVPWNITLLIVFVVIASTSLMTWIPARHASRVSPAQALHFE